MSELKILYYSEVLKCRYTTNIINFNFIYVSVGTYIIYYVSISYKNKQNAYFEKLK